MGSDNGGGAAGSAKAPAESVWIVDTAPMIQPIRLPAPAFFELHQATQKSLKAFVAEHRARFPGGPKGASRRSRRGA